MYMLTVTSVPRYSSMNALLVQGPGNLETRGTVCADIPAMKRGLGSRGFGSLLEIQPGLTPRNIEKSLDSLAEKADNNSLTFFFYTGHGNTDYLISSYLWFLSRENLFRRLAKISGSKIILLDTCDSVAKFGSFEASSKTVIITGEDSGGSLVEKTDSYRGLRNGVLTFAFLRLLRLFPGEIDLATCVDELAGSSRMREENISAVIAGSGVVLPASSVESSLGSNYLTSSPNINR